MAKINNQAIMQKLIDECKLYPGKDVIPTELAEKILPTFQVNSQEVTVVSPSSDIIKTADMTESDGLTVKTIYTTSTTDQFYLTGVFLGKTNGSTYNRVYLTVVTNGTTTLICELNGRGTATYNPINGSEIAITFNSPLKIDKGSIIQIVRGNANAGVIVGSVFGYNS